MCLLILAPLRRAARPVACLLAAFLFALLTGHPAQAAGPSTITYTGQLLSGNAPVANGLYDFQFSLYTVASGGAQTGSTVSVTSVPVEDGVFYVELNFGSAVNSSALYLQTAYRLRGGSSYTTQSPRKLLATTAFTDYSASSGYALTSGSTFRLQGKSISTVAPTDGQVLEWNGGTSLWTPTTFANPAGSVTGPMLALPLALSAANTGALLTVTNTGAGAGVYGINSGNGAYGILGGTDSQNAPVGVIAYSSTIALEAQLSNGEGGHIGTGDSGIYGYNVVQGGSAISGRDAYRNGDSGFIGGTDPLYSQSAGVYGSDTGSGAGVLGSSSGNGYGVRGNSLSGYGVSGTSNSGDAGHFYTSNGTNGIVGELGANGGNGVQGIANTGGGAYAIYGVSSSGYAGYFSGKVTVTGDLNVNGALTAGTKDFKIDHPLDPEHKYLYHASVESDKMEDIYNGHVVLDAGGAATVQLPDWFQALNKDFEYTLTCIGGFAPVYVSQEIAGNMFQIAGGKPGMKVSWQVTGVRQDAFALAHPLQLEEDKPAVEQGLYQNPDAFGQPKERGIGYAQQQAHQAHGPKQP